MKHTFILVVWFGITTVLNGQNQIEKNHRFFGGTRDYNETLYAFKSHEFSLMAGALKYANLGFDYQYSLRPIKGFAFQMGAALNFMRYDVYSTSDEHRINVGWFPLHVGSRIYLSNRNRSSTYIFGKYGYAIGSGAGESTVDSDDFSEFGIGTLIGSSSNSSFNSKSSLKLEFGRQAYTLSGQAFSSFQSTIQYDLSYTSFFFRVGLVVHK